MTYKNPAGKNDIIEHFMIKDSEFLNQNTVGMIDFYNFSQFTTQRMLFQSTPDQQIHFSGEAYFKIVSSSQILRNKPKWKLLVKIFKISVFSTYFLECRSAHITLC